MIDLAEARILLKRAMETQGRDFVYNPKAALGCAYEARTVASGRILPEDHPQRKTGCLIGVALSLAGETRHLDFHGYVETMHLDFPDMMTLPTMKYLAEAQRIQDSGGSWGYAYDTAERYVTPTISQT